jgi:hypothetical protein
MVEIYLHATYTPSKNYFLKPTTPSTKSKIKLKTQKWATDPKLGPKLGVLLCTPLFSFFGPGGIDHKPIYRVFIKIHNAFSSGILAGRGET